MTPKTPETQSLIDNALTEDLSIGDPTTDGLIPPDLVGKANLVANGRGVLAGINVALAVFKRLDPSLEATQILEDGSVLRPGMTVASLAGHVTSILMAERTALNFLQHLSGIATETSNYVQAVTQYKTRIVDTRKTVPGLRTLAKYAVRIGGGYSHRQNLGDGILIKDNHIMALRKQGMELKQIIEKAQSNASHTTKVEVEVEDLEQVRAALDAGAEILMLDNMDIQNMSEAVRMAGDRAITEASGGITLENVTSVAATGVNVISVGALTHSIKALDISLELD